MEPSQGVKWSSDHLCNSKVGDNTLNSDREVGDVAGRKLTSVDNHLEVGESTIDTARVFDGS